MSHDDRDFDPPFNAPGWLAREIEQIRDHVSTISRQLHGNGAPGIYIRLSRLEDQLTAIQRTLDTMSTRRFQLLVALGTGSSAGAVIGALIARMLP